VAEIPDETGIPIITSVLVRGNRATTVVWESQEDQTSTRDRCETRNWVFVLNSGPAGNWERPHPIVEHVCWEPRASAIVGPRGQVTVAYATRNGLMLSERRAPDAWSAPEALTRYRVRRPRLVGSADGYTVAVIWDGASREHDGVELRRRSHGRWGPIKQWLGPDVSGRSWSAAMDPAGNLTLLVDQGTDSVGVDTYDWPAAGDLGPSVSLFEATPGLINEGQADLRTNARGDIAVLTRRSDRNQDVIYSAYRPHGGTWEPPQVVTKLHRKSCCHPYNEVLAFAVGPEGTFHLLGARVASERAPYQVWHMERPAH
jgi:hypothetical protein